MSENRFEANWGNPESRRLAGMAEKEVLGYLINKGEPVKWSDIQEDIEKITGKPITGKVLSSALKRLRNKRLVGVMALNDTDGRPLIHYYFCEELPFREYSKIWHDELEQIRTKLKKRLSRQQRVKLIDDAIRHVLFWYKFSLASALWAALNSESKELGKAKFDDIFTSFTADPSNFALFLSLENKDETIEILERFRKELGQGITRHRAPHEEGKGPKRRR